MMITIIIIMIIILMIIIIIIIIIINNNNNNNNNNSNNNDNDKNNNYNNNNNNNNNNAFRLGLIELCTLLSLYNQTGHIIKIFIPETSRPIYLVHAAFMDSTFMQWAYVVKGT